MKQQRSSEEDYMKCRAFNSSWAPGKLAV